MNSFINLPVLFFFFFFAIPVTHVCGEFPLDIENDRIEPGVQYFLQVNYTGGVGYLTKREGTIAVVDGKNDPVQLQSGEGDQIILDKPIFIQFLEGEMIIKSCNVFALCNFSGHHYRLMYFAHNWIPLKIEDGIVGGLNGTEFSVAFEPNYGLGEFPLDIKNDPIKPGVQYFLQVNHTGGVGYLKRLNDTVVEVVDEKDDPVMFQSGEENEILLDKPIFIRFLKGEMIINSCNVFSLCHFRGHHYRLMYFANNWIPLKIEDGIVGGFNGTEFSVSFEPKSKKRKRKP